MAHSASHSPDEPTANDSGDVHVIILIHGIRTNALWQREIRQSLEDKGSNRHVRTLRYGYFGPVRFLAPWPIDRSGPIVEKFSREVEAAIRFGSDERERKKLSGKVYVSVVAHSFGTYVVSKYLQWKAPRKLHRIVFCGCIISEDFNWDSWNGIRIGTRPSL